MKNNQALKCSNYKIISKINSCKQMINQSVNLKNHYKMITIYLDFMKMKQLQEQLIQLMSE